MTRHQIYTAIAATLLASSAHAADFSYTGSFGLDNDRVGYAFTLGSTSTVTLTSLGYAGGTNLAGETIARGGFDPVLSIYDGSGSLIDTADDGVGAPIDAVTGQGGDAIYTASLAAGTYSVFLSQYNNFGPQTLPGNFAFDGQPNFRGGFVDFYGSQRTGAWALDISGADSVVTAAVPEPMTWALMMIGFGMVGVAARRPLRSVVA